MVFGNFAVALPLYALDTGHRAGAVSAVVAVATLSIGAGSAGSRLLARFLAPGALLAWGMLAACAGDAALLVGRGLPALGLGAAMIGCGLGLYWAGSQALLAPCSGLPGSERAYIRQYVAYTGGTVAGSVLAGVLSHLAAMAGVARAPAAHVAFWVGVAGALVAFGAARAGGGAAARAVTGAVAGAVAGAGDPPVLRVPVSQVVSLQAADLLLVAALGLLLSLAPIILETHFRVGPVLISAAYGATALAKVTGSLAAGRLARWRGPRGAILGMLGAGGAVVALLAGAGTVGIYLVLLVTAVFAISGIWPVVVDTTLAQVPPAARAAVALTWSAREYPVVALATLGGGWLLGASGRAGAVYLLAALLLAAALASSHRLTAPGRLAPAPPG